jgi:predicted transcriptional regulator
MDERLYDACKKLISSNVHRILVVDNESRMISGTIQ